MQLLTTSSAWWGESFVNELKRISEQAERKRITRRQNTAGGKTVNFDVDSTRPSTAPVPLAKRGANSPDAPSAESDAANGAAPGPATQPAAGSTS